MSAMDECRQNLAGAVLGIDLGAIRDNWRSLQARLAGAECRRRQGRCLRAGCAEGRAGALCGRLPQLLRRPPRRKPSRSARCWVTMPPKRAARSAHPGARTEFLAHGVVPVLNSQPQVDAWRSPSPQDGGNDWRRSCRLTPAWRASACRQRNSTSWPKTKAPSAASPELRHEPPRLRRRSGAPRQPGAARAFSGGIGPACPECRPASPILPASSSAPTITSTSPARGRAHGVAPTLGEANPAAGDPPPGQGDPDTHRRCRYRRRLFVHMESKPALAHRHRCRRLCRWLPAGAGNCRHAFFDGVQIPLVGKVSMDTITVDITDLPETALVEAA